MSESQEIVCKPTKWFFWRAVAMCVMFAVGAFMFFKDWKIGYPKANVERFHYIAFENAEEEFRERQESGLDAAAWEEFAKEQKVFAPIESGEEETSEVAPILPAGTDLSTPWPNVITDYATYSKLYEEEADLVSPPAWKLFSNSGDRKWKEKSEKKLKSIGKIKEQLYVGIGCLVLLAGGLFILLRTLSRRIKVDAEGYHAPGGPFVPFADMRKIDARKWDTKGLAYLYYEKDGNEKKTKIDGMVYGQFKKEEGEPAQKLYDRILENFRGELIELVSEDEDSESKSPDEEAPEKTTNDSAD